MSMFACLDSDNDEPVKPKVAAAAKDAAPAKGNAPAKAAAPAKAGSSGAAAKPAGSAAPKAAGAGGDKPKPKGTATGIHGRKMLMGSVAFHVQTQVPFNGKFLSQLIQCFPFIFLRVVFLDLC